MAQRTNRMAWGLATVLAVLLLLGAGAMLHHGVKLRWAKGMDDTEVRMFLTDGWRVGTSGGVACGPAGSAAFRVVSLGFVEVCTVRR